MSAEPPQQRERIRKKKKKQEPILATTPVQEETEEREEKEGVKVKQKEERAKGNKSSYKPSKKIRMVLKKRLELEERI